MRDHTKLPFLNVSLSTTHKTRRPRNQTNRTNRSRPQIPPGAFAAVVTRHHSLGGAGAVELAEAVVEACDQPTDFKFLYDTDLSIKVGLIRVVGGLAWVGGELVKHRKPRQTVDLTPLPTHAPTP
jgi:hypothetical protein